MMSDYEGVVRIDPDLCQGHGRCYAVAPSLFAPDDVGTGMVAKATLQTQDLGSATLAEGSCPEGAIVIELSE